MIVTADMASIVWMITVAEGETVKPGGQLLILESMKMEIPVLAPVSGVVAAILVAEGDVIDAGDALVRIERRR